MAANLVLERVWHSAVYCLGQGSRNRLFSSAYLKASKYHLTSASQEIEAQRCDVSWTPLMTLILEVTEPCYKISQSNQEASSQKSIKYYLNKIT